MHSTVRKPTDEQYTKFKVLVEKRLGLDWSKEKKYLLHGRLNSRLFELNLSYNEYYELLITDNSNREIELFYNFVTTNKTEFYREPAVFIWIKENIIPFLREEIVSGQRQKIRFWSAGCSSGEEPYSLSFDTHSLSSMLSDNSDGYKILATDINTQALLAAYKGIYHQEDIKGLSVPILNKFCFPHLTM